MDVDSDLDWTGVGCSVPLSLEQVSTRPTQDEVFVASFIHHRSVESSAIMHVLEEEAPDKARAASSCEMRCKEKPAGKLGGGISL